MKKSKMLHGGSFFDAKTGKKTGIAKFNQKNPKKDFFLIEIFFLVTAFLMIKNSHAEAYVYVLNS